jgi:hypothetical protein
MRLPRSIFTLLACLLIGSAATSALTAATRNPTPPALTTFMRDGGWCWYQDPRAIIAHGKLIIGGVSGQNGDLKVSVYDLTANRDLGTVVLHPQFQVDDHDVPALYARPDGSILAVYAKHGNERIHYTRISSPDDYLQWGPEQQFVHNYDAKPGVTYMNLYYLEQEVLLYNFFRDGPTYNPSFMTSSDHGQTWGNRTHFISDEVEGRQRPYARYLQRDANTVGITFTDAHPRNFGNSLYYADYRDGAFYRVDGTKIKDLAAGPLTTSEAQKIYQGSGITTDGTLHLSAPNSAWTSSATVDAAGYPNIGYTLYLTNDDHRYRLATWDGTRWHDREIAYAGKCLYPRESSYTGLVTLDPSDPRRVFISTDVDPTTGEDLGGTHEIYTATIGLDDETTSITWRALTANSLHRNIRPIVATGDGYRAVIWLRGPWRTYTDYESDVVGYVETTD